MAQPVQVCSPVVTSKTPAVHACCKGWQSKPAKKNFSPGLQSKNPAVQGSCSPSMQSNYAFFILYFKTEIETCSPRHLQYEPGVQACILACWHNVNSRYVVQACSPSLKFLSASFQSKPEVQNSSPRLLSHKCDVLTSCSRLLQFKLSV